MSLEFKDIGEWTPSTISIVDVPYHPLAYFEVYENDEEFVKKFKETKVNNMSNTPTNGEKTVTVSEGFIEGLINKAVAKMKPEPSAEPTNNPQNNGESEVTNAEILAEIQKQNERITALENGQNQNQAQGGDDPTQNTDPEQNEENNEQNNSGDNPGQNGTDPTPQTVELPLNPDGTLNMDDGVVAKYLPRGTGQSQALDVDLTRGTPSDKSLNERTGRSENGTTW